MDLLTRHLQGNASLHHDHLALRSTSCWCVSPVEQCARPQLQKVWRSHCRGSQVFGAPGHVYSNFCFQFIVTARHLFNRFCLIEFWASRIFRALILCHGPQMASGLVLEYLGNRLQVQIDDRNPLLHSAAFAIQGPTFKAPNCKKAQCLGFCTSL